jgi:hypothetical protein
VTSAITAGEHVDIAFVLANTRRVYQGVIDGKTHPLHVTDCDPSAGTASFFVNSLDAPREVSHTAVEQLEVLPKDASDFVYEHHNHYIRATVNGVEGVFYAVEHFNIGRGWMMRERDGKVPGIVSSSALENPVALDEKRELFSGAFLIEPRQPVARRHLYSLEDPAEYAMAWSAQLPLRAEDGHDYKLMGEVLLLLKGQHQRDDR